MSQRKATKKILKRLRSKALEKIKKYNEALEDKEDDFLHSITAGLALQALFDYVKSLEYAYSEYDEEWNKLEAIKLEKMKKAIEDMPDKSVKKKDEGKKKEGSKDPFYIK